MRPLIKEQSFKSLLLLAPGQPEDASFGDDLFSCLVRRGIEIKHLLFRRRACSEGPGPERVRINQNQTIGQLPVGENADSTIGPQKPGSRDADTGTISSCG